jgi:hypothetical protein
MDIEKIKKAVKKKNCYTYHAIQKMIDRDINTSDIREAIESGEVIEEYPRVKYGPSCLIFGFTRMNRPIHLLVSYSDPFWVITAYEPSNREWINFRKRKSK